MFRDAIDYPTRSDDLGRKYLIGALLAIGSLLIVPAFFLLGYMVKVVSETLEGNDQLPEFKDYRTLFIDGLKLTGVMIAYFIAPLIPIAGLNSLFIGTSMEAVIGAANLVILTLVLYLLPSAVVNLARDGKVRSAFRIREVMERAYSRRYFRGALILFGTGILIGIVELSVLFILTITIIGIPLLIAVIPAMQFYENLVYFRMMAKMAE